MLREIYFRDPTDSKYNISSLEVNSKLEAVLNKIRMILFTNRGDVLGYPELGMDLDDYIFNFKINENVLRDRFYSQIATYIPERDFKIDIDFSFETDGVKDFMYLYITVDRQRILGILIS
jgi:hypothetical protein